MPRFDTSDGLSLHFTDEGKGLPILCLAGLTRNGDDFQFVRPHLSAHRTITLDSRGRGMSEYDANYSNYSLPRETQDVIELCEHLGLKRVIILGTSRGGLLAMALTAMKPDLLQGVILNDIGPVIEADGLAKIGGYVGTTPNAATIEEAAEQMARGLGDQFKGVPKERWLAQAAAQYRQADSHVAIRYDARLRDALIEQASNGAMADLWPFFDAFKGIPVSVIRGENSDLLSAETVKEMQRRNKDLIAVTVPGRGHVPFLDEPESLRAINAVLESVLAPA